MKKYNRAYIIILIISILVIILAIFSLANTKIPDLPEDSLSGTKASESISSENITSGSSLGLKTETTKIKNNTPKNEWVATKLEEEAAKVESSASHAYDITLCINDNDTILPFKASKLTELGFEDHEETPIIKRGESYGNNRTFVDNQNTDKNIMTVAYLNATDTDLSREDCLVSNIQTESNLVKLKLMASGNEIKIGDSLIDILKLLKDNDYVISYNGYEQDIKDEAIKELVSIDDNKDNMLAFSDVQGNWKVYLRNYKENLFDTDDKLESKHLTEELLNNSSIEIVNFEYVISGNNKNGVTNIDLNCEVFNNDILAYRYDLLYQ